MVNPSIHCLHCPDEQTMGGKPMKPLPHQLPCAIHADVPLAGFDP
jgi:hypothetical protein